MAADLYSAHFGFRERPFSLSPDPDFIFWSKSHNRAFSVLEYGLMTNAPLTVVTGEVGTGKTTLIQALLQRIEHEITIGLISNAQGDRGDLIRWVLNAMDVALPEVTDYVALFQHFQDFVLGEYAAGKRVALIVDEAQNLGPEMLEELRMLTNINSGKDELLQIILVGQPELRDLITRPELRQFAQRVTATFHIDPFSRADTHDYIVHRLQHAGGTGEEFEPLAIRHIYEHSEGIPRVINKLCDLSLVYAASSDLTTVGAITVREVFKDGLVLKSERNPIYLAPHLEEIKKANE
jgi:type II secretory pathway predicted ATPase ExeA